LKIFTVILVITGCSKQNYGDINITLLNSLTMKEIQASAPFRYNRVELPPSFLIKAHVSAGVKSVKFILPNGVEIVDNEVPFLIEEHEIKLISASSEMGIFQIEVCTYDSIQARGKETGYLKKSLIIALTGMDPDFQRLDTPESAEWIGENIDRVLQRNTFIASNKHEMPYRIFIPPFYSESVKYPLLVFLHGRGQRGSDNGPQIYSSELFLGEGSIVTPNMQFQFPSIVLVPQCSDKTEMEEWARWIGNSVAEPFKGLGKDGNYKQNQKPSDSGQAFLELLEETLQKYSVDKNRVYLTGVSMGGFGTWDFITRRPELFAAAVPMAGYSDPSKASKITHIPIWIFHGNSDQWNPVQGSRIMYETLLQLGGNIRYTEYENTGHNETFQYAWQEKELFKWMFSQQLNNR
jgi:predicted esterase